MKRILVVSDYYQPVIGYAKVHVVRQLMSFGHELKVVTSDRYFPFENYKNTMDKVLGDRIKSVGTKTEKGIKITRKKTYFEMFARAIYSGLRGEIENFKPDVVILFGTASFSAINISFLDKNSLGYKLVLVDTHLPSEYKRGNGILKKIFYRTFRALFAKRIEKAADKIIAAQDDTKWIINNIYGIRRKVERVDLGTDDKVFKYSKSARKELRLKTKINEGDFVIEYTGKIVKSKGVHLLFEAFEILAKKHKDFYLSIVGKGEKEYIDYCKGKVSKEFQERILWFPYQPENMLYKYYSFADVLVWPMQDSTSMNDAAACKRVFIANHKLGARTRIENENALLYKLGDSIDLAKKILWLYQNKKQRLAMGERGRELVEKKLSWKQLAKEYIAV